MLRLLRRGTEMGLLMDGESGEEGWAMDVKEGKVGDCVGDSDSVEARGYNGSSIVVNSSILIAGADVFVVAALDDAGVPGGVDAGENVLAGLG